MTPAEQAVIDAARAWDAWRGGPTLIPRDSPESRLNAAVAALDASFAPDEVNESAYWAGYRAGVEAQYALERAATPTPDEVNEAET